MAAPDSNKRRKQRILFCLEMLILAAFLGILFLYGQITSRLGELSAPTAASGEAAQNQEFHEADIVMNNTAPRMTGYRTVAFFGLDHRENNPELGGENSDTIIICSVNNDTQDVKMVSVFRDTLLDIGDDIYAKANAAYAYGGPAQAISMLNTNLDLDITDYVTVDFNAVVDLVDAVGGLDIPMSYAELVHMNNYCVETSEETGRDYVPIELPENEPADLEKILGTYHLNGVQATSYCRIRYTANLDMGRTERQRRVIQMVAQKLKTSGITKIFRIMDAVFPKVKTSLTKTEILSMIPQMITYKVDETTGFPFDYKFSDIKGSIIVADTLRTNVEKLHAFLYGDQEDYVPSDNIWSISSNIIEIVGGEAELREDAPIVDDTNGIDNFFWQHYTSDEGSSDSTSYTAAEPSGTDYSGTPSYDSGSSWSGSTSGTSYSGSGDSTSGYNNGTGYNYSTDSTAGTDSTDYAGGSETGWGDNTSYDDQGTGSYAQPPAQDYEYEYSEPEYNGGYTGQEDYSYDQGYTAEDPGAGGQYVEYDSGAGQEEGAGSEAAEFVS